MAIDRPGAEAVEKQSADASPPPPPPDRPGEEGFPSRAESRARAAAAAGKGRQRDKADDSSDTSRPEAAGEEQDTVREDGAQPSEAPERRTPDTQEPWDSADDPDREPEDDDGSRPGPEPAFRAATRGDEHAVVEAADETEAFDRRTPYGENTGIDEQSTPIDAPAEAADEQRPADLGPPLDHPGAEPGEVASQSDDAELAADDAADGLSRSYEPTGDGTEPIDRRASYGEVGGDRDPAAGEPPALTGGGDIDKPPDLPTGEEPLKAAGDKSSRADRARRTLYESGEDVHDITERTGDDLQDLFGLRPPTGHPVTAEQHPVFVADHQAIDGGDLATSLLVSGLVAAEGVRALVRYSRSRRKGPDDAGDR